MIKLSLSFDFLVILTLSYINRMENSFQSGLSLLQSSLKIEDEFIFQTYKHLLDSSIQAQNILYSSVFTFLLMTYMNHYLLQYSVLIKICLYSL